MARRTNGQGRFRTYPLPLSSSPSTHCRPNTNVPVVQVYSRMLCRCSPVHSTHMQAGPRCPRESRGGLYLRAALEVTVPPGSGSGACSNDGRESLRLASPLGCLGSG